MGSEKDFQRELKFLSFSVSVYEIKKMLSIISIGEQV